MKYHSSFRLLALLSVAAAWIGCSDDTPATIIQQPEATNFGDVSGVIADAGTGVPNP